MKFMLKLAWIAIAALLLGVVTYWVWVSSENARTIRRLQQEKEHLQQIVTRLTSERRAAEMIVTGRRTEGDTPQIDLLFVEYARDGQTPVRIKEFTIEGTEVHVDAKVIRFERDFLFENDPLRNCSVALFTRIFGDRTSPENAQPIDPPGEIPAVYQGAQPAAAEFEARLWSDFWRLLEDAPYAHEHGVRIAQGEGVWWPPQEGKLYTLSIAADGGIELTSQPVKAIYLEAMKKFSPATLPSRP